MLAARQYDILMNLAWSIYGYQPGLLSEISDKAGARLYWFDPGG
jgi:hypothetical protein